jgi:tRNA A37 threonylcarbamoyladenosine biosynthesis protein TsaE
LIIKNNNPCNSIFKILSDFNYAVIFINGPMGVGKTSFSRNLAKRFNINCISSSSFSLINISFGDRTLIHADFYRQSYTLHYEDDILPYLDKSYLILFEWCKPTLIDKRAQHFTLDISFSNQGSRQYLFNTFPNSKSSLANTLLHE